MKHLLSKSKAEGGNQDEEEVDTRTMTLEDLIEATKGHTVMKVSSQYQLWDCIALESSSTNHWAKTLNKWADLAYQGDWEGLLSVGLESPVLINSRRLQKRIGVPARPSAGYTALHQAAWHGASAEIVQALVNLGAHRWERTTTGKNERPIDIALSKGHTNPALLAVLEPPNLLPQWSQEDLQAVEKNFHDIIRTILNGIAEDEQLRLPSLDILRELGEGIKVNMRVPGMYGGFCFYIEGDHLVSESSSRIVGGSGLTYHITPKEATLVDSGWG